MSGVVSLPAARDVPGVTAAQMAEIDEAAVALGISTEMLMENAARQVALACRALLGPVAGKRIVCLAGSGNNGGDAFAAARRLRVWGADVACVTAAPRERLSDLNRRQRDVVERIGIPVAPAEGSRLEGAVLLVDGLLGYSVRGAPRGDAEALIREADRSHVPILAVDLPSGLDPDRGVPLGVAIRATATVTLGLPKTGLLRPEARSLVGDLLLADIGVPPSLYDRFGIDARPCFVAGDLVRVIV